MARIVLSLNKVFKLRKIGIRNKVNVANIKKSSPRTATYVPEILNAGNFGNKGTTIKTAVSKYL